MDETIKSYRDECTISRNTTKENDKRIKYEKNLLRQFELFSDDMLLSILKTSIAEYMLLVKSEQKAIDFMKLHGINNFPILNKITKEKTEKLIEVAKLRNITIPDEFFLVNISTDDVIARIQQFKYEEICWIEEHSYLYDLTDPDYDTNDIMNLITANCTSEEAIKKIDRYYNYLINSYRIYQETNQENLIDLGNGKKWIPDLWKPIGYKPFEIDDYIKPGQSTGGFIPYQAPDDRYEVRGIMPSSKNKTLILTPPKHTGNK